MYCVNCGQKMDESTLRCPNCRRWSLTLWLTLFAAVVWLAAVEANYGFFSGTLPFIAGTFFAVGAWEAPQFILWQLSWSNFLASWALPIIFLVVTLSPLFVRRLVGSYGWTERLRRPMAVIGALVLIFASTVLVADGRYLISLWPKVEAAGEQQGIEEFEARAQDAMRKVIIAEYRHRELNPQMGFTCDVNLLEPLGAPPKTDSPYRTVPKERGTVLVGVYTLSLKACQGQPVAKYELSAVPDPASYPGKAAAYCSDGSGALYFSADGKSETCLADRKPVQ